MRRLDFHTPESVAAEKYVERLLWDRRGWVLHHLPPSHSLDFIAVDNRNRLQAWIEVKSRSISSTDYPTATLSLLKYRDGLLWANTTGKPFLLFYAWTDQTGVVRFDPGHSLRYAVRQGGRTRKTRDSADIHPEIQIPIRDFSLIQEPALAAVS